MEWITNVFKYLTGTTLPSWGDATAFGFALAIDPNLQSKPTWYRDWMDKGYSLLAGMLSGVVNLFADWFGYEQPAILADVSTKFATLNNTVDTDIPDTVVDASIAKAQEVVTGLYSGLGRFSKPDLANLANGADNKIQIAVEETIIKTMLKENGVDVSTFSYKQINDWLASDPNYQSLHTFAAEFANKISDSARDAIKAGDAANLTLAGDIASYAAANNAMGNVKTRIDALVQAYDSIKANQAFKTIGLTDEQLFKVAQAVDAGKAAGATEDNNLIASELADLHAIPADKITAAIKGVTDGKDKLENILNNFQDVDIEAIATGSTSHNIIFQSADGSKLKIAIDR